MSSIRLATSLRAGNHYGGFAAISWMQRHVADDQRTEPSPYPLSQGEAHARQRDREGVTISLRMKKVCSE
jgi:hypothetical protein